MDDFTPLAKDDFEPLAPPPQDVFDLPQKAAITQWASDVGSRVPPERNADVIRLSAVTGLPPQSVHDNFDLVKGEIDRKKIDYEALAKTHPVLSEFLSQPERAGVAKDDEGVLGTIEGLFRGWRDIPKGAGQQWDQGAITQEKGRIGARMMDGRATKADLDRLKAIEADEASNKPLKFGYLSGFIPQSAQAASQFFGPFRDPEATVRIWGTAGAGALAGAAAGAPALGVGAGPGAAAGFFAGLGAGVQSEATYANAIAEGGNAYLEYMKIPGVTHEDAVAAGRLVGLVNGGIEFIALDKVVGLVPGARALLSGTVKGTLREALKDTTRRAAVGRLMKAIAAKGLVEGAQEAAQEFVTIFEGIRVRPDQPNSMEALKESFGEDNRARMWESFVGGTQMSLIGLPSSMVQFHSDFRKAQQSEVNAALFTALGDAAKESKTRSRLPSVFRSFVDSVQEETGGPVESVKVPASNLNTLFQTEGITSAEVEREMPEVARQMREAVEAGTPELEVAVPIADMATKIAPLPGYAGLHEDMRIGDGLTIRESKKVMAEAEKIYTENQDPAREATPAEKVAEDIGAKMEATGMHPKTARQQAVLWSAFAEARASRTGAKDAWDYYQKARVEVQRDEKAGAGENVLGAEGGKRGFVSFDNARTYFSVTLTGKSNLSTFLHESGHVFNEMLRRDAAAGHAESAADLNALGEFAGQAPSSFTVTAPGWGDLARNAMSGAWHDGSRIGLTSTQILNETIKSFKKGIAELGDDARFADSAAKQREAMEQLLATDPATIKVQAGYAADNWSVEAIEKVARAFEKYLAEGEAPSNKLEVAFRSFKDWMAMVYRTLVGLNVELDERTRQVFGRLLATDQEINERARTTGLTMPDFGEVKGGIFTEAEHARLKGMWDDGIAAMKESLLASSITALRRDVDAERARVEAEVSAELNADKTQNAWAWLVSGKRLDDAPVELEHGKIQAQAVKDAPITDQERRRLKKVTTEDFATTFDEIAPYLGFDSGSEMVVALARRESLQKARRRMVDERMAAMYPEGTQDYISKGATEEVQKAISGRLGRVLEAELDAVGAKVGGEPGRVILAAIRQAARRAVAGMTMAELDPAKYARAAAKAQKDYLEAIATGEGAIAAFQAKRNHAWALEMWRAAGEAQAKVESIRKYLDTFSHLPKRSKIFKAGANYLAAIDALLEGIEFKRRTGTTLHKRAGLAAYLAEMEAAGETVNIPVEARTEALLKNYRQMSLDELLGVEAAVSNLETLARLKNKLSGIQANRKLSATSADLADSIHDSWAEKGEGKIHPGLADEMKRFLRKGRADLLKIEFLCRALDGGKTAGLAHTLIFLPFARAEAEKMRLVEQILGEFKKPFDDMPVAERMRLHRKVDFLGEQLSFSEVLAVALNWGNEGNREKLLEGYKGKGWTEQKVMDRLDELLEARDWQLVAHIWKTIDSLWPMITDLARRSVGAEVEKVQGVTIHTRHGPVAGGYYPVVYDRKQRGPRAGKGMALRDPEELAQMKSGQLFENNFMAPGGLVDRGFTKSRTKYAAPILLSLSVVPAHVTEVIHYLTHFEAVRDVDKLLRQDVVKTAVEDAVGVEGYKAFRPWLQAIANNGKAATAALYYETFLRKARLGTSIVMLGGKLTTGLIQALGLLPAMKELKTKHVLSGFKTFLTEGFEEARKESPSFRYQEQHFDRDLGDVYDRMASTFGEVSHLRNQITTMSMAWIKLVQGSVNAVTWYAAREQAEAQGHADPVAYADATVRLTQSSGGIKDLAAVQRGGETQKLFTVMYSYFSTLFGQLAEPVPDAKTTKEKTAIYAARWWWAVMLPVVVEAMLRGKKPDGDEPEDWATFMLKEQLLYTGRTIPFIGDIADAALSGRQPRGNPWLSTMTKGVKALGGAAGEGEMTESQKRAVIDLIGAATRMPTGGAVNAYRYLDAFTSGQMEEPMQNLLFRSPGGWR